MLKSYQNIYKRCGVKAVNVQASSGSIGGEESQEFMVLAESGEDAIKFCPKCGYAANVEVVKVAACPKCKSKLEQKNCIEAGHIFKLGTMYSEKMRAYFSAKGGSASGGKNKVTHKKPIYMGCYGIGLGRLLATIVEASHDGKGIIWPQKVAPFQTHLIKIKNSVNKKADKIYQSLVKEKIDVLYDDREDVSVGEKFAESDLIGIPIRLVVSEKTGARVEWKERGSAKTEILELKEVLKKLS